MNVIKPAAFFLLLLSALGYGVTWKLLMVFAGV